MNKIIHSIQLSLIYSVVFLLTPLVAVAQDSTLNKYGLWVISKAKQLQKTVLQNPAKQMLDIKINIPDLVLDLRYNGGGYIYIANEVASMIAGTKAIGRVFEQLQYNDKHPDWTAQSKFLFTNKSRAGQDLPQLNLTRVFILTSSRTCSASETIINGLSPFVQVITIGGNTCGKPYGFSKKDNCGTAYFAIEFDGINDAGKGGYVNGFAPTCPASDDLENELGSLNERLLANAASYSRTGVCGSTGYAPPPALGASVSHLVDYEPSAWRNNKIRK